MALGRNELRIENALKKDALERVIIAHNRPQLNREKKTSHLAVIPRRHRCQQCNRLVEIRYCGPEYLCKECMQAWLKIYRKQSGLLLKYIDF